MHERLRDYVIAMEQLEVQGILSNDVFYQIRLNGGTVEATDTDLDSAVIQTLDMQIGLHKYVDGDQHFTTLDLGFTDIPVGHA